MSLSRTATSKHLIDNESRLLCNHKAWVGGNCAAFKHAGTRSGDLKLDADTGDVLLSSDTGLEWIVGGHQVGARFLEKELGTARHLGGPSPVHGNDGSLRLWFAVDQDKNEMVVVLTMSVKSRSKSKSRPRNFFLLVPAEDLRISSAMPDFQPIPLDSIPEALFERPSDAVSAKATRILHVSFALGHKRTCGVVMTTRPYSAKLRGTPLALLDGLKSLSEANHFDLYLKFSSYAQVGLRRMCTQITTRNIAFFTPHFDLTDMYRGGCDGDYGLWEAQGWHDDTQEVPSRKRKASRPPLEEQVRGPPAYDGRDMSAPAYADTSILRVPYSSHANQQRSDPTLRPEVCESPCLVPIASSVVCDSIVSGIPATPQSPNTPIFFDTVSKKSPSAPAPATAATPTLITAIDSSSLNHLYDQEMGTWLLTAWNLIPNIHFTLLDDLIAIANAVTNRNESTYRLSRMTCAKNLTNLVADQIQNAQSNESEPTRLKKLQHDILASEPESLISWLFLLGSEGELGFMVLLGRFEGRRREALVRLGDGGDEEGFRECFGGVMVLRAAIVLQALCLRGR